LVEANDCKLESCPAQRKQYTHRFFVSVGKTNTPFLTKGGTT